MKTALITGIAGQDGSYLAELLLSKGYKVHGLVRKIPGTNDMGFSRIRNILNNITIHTGDLTDLTFIRYIVADLKPDEIYHLATTHEVGITANEYVDTRSINTDSTVFFLSAISEISPNSRFFYASSSNVFSATSDSPQNEKTSISPCSIYGIAKASSMYHVRLFREQKGVFACSGILYNHESPRRDEFFLPRKITSSVARIKLGLANELVLGDLNARRDWGFAGDFVEAMWLMLHSDNPKDYLIGTGITHSVMDVLELAFSSVNLNWNNYVKVNSDLVRPEVKCEIVADTSAIKSELGWFPKVSFEQLIRMMVVADLDHYRNRMNHC